MRWALLVVVAGCGRIDFDATHVVPSDSTPDAPDTSLVARYPMEMLANASTPDVTGHGHDLMCDVCPALVSGRATTDHAASFTGATQRLFTSGAGDLVTANGFTVTVWFALPATTANRACIATKLLGQAIYNSWALCVESTRQLLFYSVSGMTTDFEFTNVTVPDASWHHAAIAWDGTMKSVFLDGVLVMSHASPIDFDDGAVSVGADLDNGSTVAPFPGMIDEVRIYNRVLDAAEIRALAM